MRSLNWKSSSGFDFHRFRDSDFQVCFLGKTFSLVKDRKCSEYTEVVEPRHHNLQYMKAGVERSGGQGTEWRVIEEPALVFQYGEVQYITTVWQVYELAKNISRIERLEELHRWVVGNRENWSDAGDTTVPFVMLRQKMPIAEFPFYQHTSHSSGGNAPLSWSIRAQESGVELALSKIAEILIAFQTHRTGRT